MTTDGTEPGAAYLHGWGDKDQIMSGAAYLRREASSSSPGQQARRAAAAACGLGSRWAHSISALPPRILSRVDAGASSQSTSASAVAHKGAATCMGAGGV